jgi:uncharacterized protein
MTRIRNLLLALIASALVFGTASAAGVAFDASAFDPYDEDEGYIDLVLEDGMMTVTFDESMGSLDATMEGDAMPLDSDVDEYRLGQADALALYGGLPVSTTPTSVTVEVDGDGQAIHDAVLARLGDLGLSAEEMYLGGPVRTYQVTHGEDAWLVAITPRTDFAVISIWVD